MNAFLEKLLKSMLAISSTIFQTIGENLIDNFTNFYRAIITLGLLYILLTGLISDGIDSLKKFVILLFSVSLVYFILIDFPNYKYYIFDTIIAIPADLSNYFTNISILGKNISKGDSITKVIWNVIKNDLFGVLITLKVWNLFNNIFLIITVFFTAFCLLVLYINYWIVYFTFVFEITILGIIGLPIILMSPFKTFRPVLISWLKAIFGAALPPVMISLIMLIVKGFIIENSKDLAKASQINKESAQNALESIAVVSFLAIASAKGISKYIAILTGIQDNAFNLFKPVGAALGAIGRGQDIARTTKLIGKGIGKGTGGIKKGILKLGSSGILGSTVQGQIVSSIVKKKIPLVMTGSIIQGLK